MIIITDLFKMESIGSPDTGEKVNTNPNSIYIPWEVGTVVHAMPKRLTHGYNFGIYTFFSISDQHKKM